MEDEDLEEMKFLREIHKKKEAIERKQTISYKLELNRNLINKKTQSADKLSKPKQTIDESVDESVHESDETKHVSEIMGFSSFGRTKTDSNVKTAKKFDIEKLLAERPNANKWKTFGELDNNEESKSNSDSDVCQPIETESKVKSNQSIDNKNKSDSESDSELIGPPLPPDFKYGIENSEDLSDEESEEETDTSSRYDVLPVSHEIELIHGSKSVTALALDPNGSRVVSGGVDYEMRFWDFQGMDSSLQSFRAITPCESHPIKNVEFSANGDVILVISGACIAKIVDRDGFVKGETIKGDQYITDMNHTKGHVAMLNDGTWHSRDKELFATCSNDGTCRIWNVQNLKTHKSVIKPRSSGGLRATPNSCRFTRNGELISVGCNDGSIQMWDTRRSFVNTSRLVRDAHNKGTEISCIQFSYDGNNLLSRGTDETLKLWDMKMLKNPLFTKEDLFNRFSMTDCFFSPDDRLIATGVSCRKGEDFGRLLFYSRQTSDLKYEIKVNNGGVIRSSWHPKLNQIIVGSSNGALKVYYDPLRSERGAKLCVVKQKRKYKESYEMIEPQIIAPHALPLFKTERKKSWRVQMIKARKDPVRSHRPELPVTGPGQGGRIASAGNTFASFIARNLGVKNKTDDNEDPREALLKHAKEAAENPYWVTPAYKTTQPKPIFAQTVKDDDEDDDGQPVEKRPHIPV